MADFAANEIGDFCLDVLMAYQLGLPGVSRVCACVCVCVSVCYIHVCIHVSYSYYSYDTLHVI